VSWSVDMSKRAGKAAKGLPQKVIAALIALIREIEESGPVRGNWPNYGKLGGGRHHCHLKKGKPTYVAVWAESREQVRFVEVVYVGTHEGAPY
jgi:hypothetical protein